MRSSTKRLVILFLLSIFVFVNEGNYYCERNCSKNVVHTVCRRKNLFCGRAYSCPRSATTSYLNDEEVELLITLHNNYRNFVAFGNETRWKNSSASDMSTLSYDIELQFIAQCWANTCLRGRDSCRWSERFPTVGQNTYEGFYSEKYLQEAFDYWVRQKWAVQDHILDNYSNQAFIFHSYYTQLIWAETQFFGCGRSIANEMVYVVCNYAPEGNILGKSIFKRGIPCSQCPQTLENNTDTDINLDNTNNTTKCLSEKYKNLCGNITNNLKWITPFKQRGFSTASKIINQSPNNLFILFIINYVNTLLNK